MAGGVRGTSVSRLGTGLQPGFGVGLCKKHMVVRAVTSASLACDNWPGLFVIIWKELKMESVSFRWALVAALLGTAAVPVGPLPMAKSSPVTRGLAPRLMKT